MGTGGEYNEINLRTPTKIRRHPMVSNLLILTYYLDGLQLILGLSIFEIL